MFRQYENHKCLFALCGPPASGKSTFLNETVVKFSQRKNVNFDYVIISPDDIIREINDGKYLWSPTSASLAWEEAYVRLEKELQSGKNHIFFDSTMCAAKRRKDFLRKAHSFNENDYKMALIRLPYVDTSVLLERNRNREGQVIEEKVITDMVNNIKSSPPSVEEGWDYMIDSSNIFG
jgi:predicted kinase